MGTAMTRYGQIGWRMAAFAAFVGTAALAVVLTRTPARDDVSLSSEVSGRVCSTSGLEAWLGLGGAGAGGRGGPGQGRPPPGPPGRGTPHPPGVTHPSPP